MASLRRRRLLRPIYADCLRAGSDGANAGSTDGVVPHETGLPGTLALDADGTVYASTGYRGQRGDDAADPMRATWERDQILHTFGNLTLLTQPLNSSVSNGPFSQKRPNIAKQSRLRMNAYFQEFENSDVRNQDPILVRGQKLFEVAKRVWPGPGRRGLSQPALASAFSPEHVCLLAGRPTASTPRKTPAAPGPPSACPARGSRGWRGWCPRRWRPA